MLIRKAFKSCLCPNESQKESLAVQFGHARFIYNWALATRKTCYAENGKGLAKNAVKTMLPDLKRHPDSEWLAEADSQVLQAKIDDLDRAFVNFFEKRAKYPKFKSKKSTQSIRYPQRFKFDGKRIYLPKVGWVRAVFHRPLEGKAKNVTVTKAKSGEYYASVQCEVEITPQPNGKPPVGVDLGLKHFAVLSTGERVEHPKHLRRAEKRLARLGRQKARKKKGGQNRAKARARLARLSEHVAHQRADFHHKLSRRLVREHGAIHLEDLNIVGMVKNHRLAKSISDSGWGEFRRQLEYKASWYGAEVRYVDRFYPSSRLCAKCGTINADLTRADRKWTCTCGIAHDRDHNASINLLNAPTVGATGRQRLGRLRKTSVAKAKAQRSLNQEAQVL